MSQLTSWIVKKHNFLPTTIWMANFETFLAVLTNFCFCKFPVDEGNENCFCVGYPTPKNSDVYTLAI